LFASKQTSIGVDVMITIFGDFCQIFSEKNDLLLENQCYDPDFTKSSSILNKTRQFVRNFLARIFSKS
jgi:hypothetical protein